MVISKALTIGGKPVTVQVTTAGGQKTVTLVTSQAGSNVGSSGVATTITSSSPSAQPTTSFSGT